MERKPHTPLIWIDNTPPPFNLREDANEVYEHDGSLFVGMLWAVLITACMVLGVILSCRWIGA